MILKVVLALLTGWIVVLLVLLFCEIRIAQKATKALDQVIAIYHDLEAACIAWIEADKRAEKKRAEVYERYLEKWAGPGSEIDTDENRSAD